MGTRVRALIPALCGLCLWGATGHAQDQRDGAVRDLSMRAEQDKALAEGRIRSVKELSSALQDGSAKARRELESLHKELDEVQKALATTTELLEQGVQAPAATTEPLRSEQESLRSEAERYDKLTIALSMRAASKSAEGVSLAEAVASSASGDTSSAAMYTLSLLQADLRAFDKARNAVAGIRSSSDSGRKEALRNLVGAIESATKRRR